MDVVNFKKFYLLPLLKELKASLDPTSDTTLGESFLTFFASGVSFKLEGNRHVPRPVEVNDQVVYKSIYIHLPFTKKLYNYLYELALENNFENCQSEETKNELIHSENPKEVIRQISFSRGNIPQDFWAICSLGVIEIAKDFYYFILNSINRTEEYINRSEALDKDLVDLI